MKKHLKRLMRHQGYTVELSNKEYVFEWRGTGIYNPIAKKSVSSTSFRAILGEKPKIEATDKKNKIIYVELL